MSKFLFLLDIFSILLSRQRTEVVCTASCVYVLSISNLKFLNTINENSLHSKLCGLVKTLSVILVFFEEKDFLHIILIIFIR